jgi:sugar fermentation stimulation protein A
MEFEQPLIEGTLINRDRYKAHVKLPNGDEVIAHCANPGSLKGCAEPGSKVLLSVLDNPRRRYRHQLEIVYAGQTPVGIHTGRPVAVAMEAIARGLVQELAGYATLRREPKVGGDAALDFLLEGNGLRPCHVHVENVTMAYEGVAYFPDVAHPKGIHVLNALTDIVREGRRAMLFFLAQREDVEWFRPADHVDPDFGQTFRDTLARGVEAVCYRSRVAPSGIEIDKRLAVDLGG